MSGPGLEPAPPAAEPAGASRHTRWYVRRRGRAVGVYPQGAIADFLLLGRLDGDDEVSPDGTSWTPLREAPPLASLLRDPRRRTEDALGVSWHDERVQAARRWADERSGIDRRGSSEPPGEAVDQRSGGERRSGRERFAHVSWRRIRAHLAEPPARPRRRRWWLAPAAGVAVVGLLIGALQPDRPSIVVGSRPANCTSTPAPGVNLAGCDLRGARLGAAALANAKLAGVRLRGADLRGADLSYADLEGADLTGANLEGARLFGARLSGANLTGAGLATADLGYADLRGALLVPAVARDTKLGHALWIDGRRCAPTSIGRCD